jgi:dethiobiotin synthetase
MTRTWFVTGTDTDVGKTLVAAGMLLALQALGKTTAAIKPVAAGVEPTEHGPRNTDAIMLQQYQSARLSYQQVNPVLLQRPLAPHIAALLEQRRVTVDQLAGHCRGFMARDVDVVLIEGAGGWRVPINGSETLDALPAVLGIPAILVVGMRLGCINHALLTAEAICRDGVPLLGWVANQLDPGMAAFEANLDTLRQRLPGQFLGCVPWLEQPQPQLVAAQLNLSPLLEPF